MNIFIKEAKIKRCISLYDYTARYDMQEDKFVMYGRMKIMEWEYDAEKYELKLGVNFCNQNNHIIYVKEAGYLGSLPETKDTTFYLTLLNFKNRVDIESLYYVQLFTFLKKLE